jgi:hypothetical protein
MLESAVSRTRINETGKPQLFYISQTLNPWVLYNAEDEITRYADKAIHRVVDNFPGISQINHWPIFEQTKIGISFTSG